MTAGQQASTAGAANFINISNRTISDLGLAASASASFNLRNDGHAAYSTLNSGSGDFPFEWMNPPPGSPPVGNYEVLATLQSGSISSGVTGSWVSLSSSRAWAVFIGSPGSQNAQLLIQIRLVSSGVVMAQATIILQSTWIP